MKLYKVRISEFLCGYFLLDEAEFAAYSRDSLRKKDNEVQRKINHKKIKG